MLDDQRILLIHGAFSFDVCVCVCVFAMDSGNVESARNNLEALIEYKLAEKSMSQIH